MVQQTSISFNFYALLNLKQIYASSTVGNDTAITQSDFLPFGFAHGDSRGPTTDDGFIGAIQLATDVVIFGSRQNRVYVRHIFSSWFIMY